MPAISQVKLAPPQITCVDTTQISDGYFYLIKNERKKNYNGEEKLAVFTTPYFIGSSCVDKETVDKIYENSYTLDDTVKFLCYTPKLDNYLDKIILDSPCIEVYKKGMNLSKLIKPNCYYNVHPINKYRKGDQIGFCYVKIKWLHLKVSDYVATPYFDYPYTLSQPFAKTKMYDIYIPIELLQINNKVFVKKRKIVLIKPALQESLSKIPLPPGN